MADVHMSLEEYMALMARVATALGDEPIAPSPTPSKLAMKPKKKVSRYNREFGRQLKRLKAKHPKTQTKNLMKRAHALTKKALKS